ncbi:MAG: tetratricopeptide repeat protein [Acidiferrobacterales bacterium]|nr:tetratricopeptide repeat protein [Acidiferrobacterales bacterium]
MTQKSTHKNSYSAEQLCHSGITNLIGMQANAIDYIDQAIAVDPQYTLALLVKAWMLHGGRNPEALTTIQNLIADIESTGVNRNTREWALLSALKLARNGDTITGAQILDKWLNDYPLDLLVHQIAHEEIFWTGNAKWMRNVIERAAPFWSSDADDYGAFLSLRAFANEEAGDIDSAERYGRMAVEMNSGDIWGTHAVAHVLYMRGDTEAGIEWLQDLSQNWLGANQMRHHLWWHLCLFLLEKAQYSNVIELLHSEVRNPESSLVVQSPAAPIDIQNYSSLLLRLQLYGIDTSDLWDPLVDICADRVNHLGNAFGSIHDTIVLAATGQHTKANEFIKLMRAQYAGQTNAVALSYHKVGIPVSEAVLAYFRQDYSSVLRLLGAVRYDLPLIGASHAQRDLFYHLLIIAAEREANHSMRAELINDVEQLGFAQVSNRAAYQDQRH